MFEAFAWSLVLKSRKFRMHRDDKQGLTFRRGLPYSVQGFLEPQNGKWSTCAFFFSASSWLQFISLCTGLRKTQYTEDEALLALLQGHEGALDYYFPLYYAPLSYFAFRLTQDKYQAEEIASEAFIKLWHHREKMIAEGSVKAWLYSIVRNAAIDYLRKVKRLRVNLQGLQSSENVEQSVLQKMIQTETIYRIIHILELLPPRCRQVFQLYFFQGKAIRKLQRNCRYPLTPSVIKK